jgi:CSLREA domain-containing protein
VILLGLVPPNARGAVTFVVDSTGDAGDSNTSDGICDDGTGACTLRAAIQQANATAGADEIHFNNPGPGPHTIAPTSMLPTITDPVVVDGTTEPDFVSCSEGPVIELDGTGVLGAGDRDGLEITAGNSTIRGLVVNRFVFPGSGIDLQTAGGNTVECNYLGTSLDESAAAGNARGIVLGSPSNTVGGSTLSARNVISGNELEGIRVDGASNVIQGNYIGTNAAGDAALGTGLAQNLGIFVNGGGGNTVIGGTGVGQGNVVSGNGATGIAINGSGTLIRGNLIGVSADGVAAVGNGGHGIHSSSTGIAIGGTSAGARNVISGNDGFGIWLPSAGSASLGNLIQGNYIGVGSDGITPLGNAGGGIGMVQVGTFGARHQTIGGTAPGAGNLIAGNLGPGIAISGNGSTADSIQGNAIFDNSGLAIDLGNDGVTPNDTDDPDTGPNHLQNFPVLDTATASGGTTEIEGSLNSEASKTYRLEFFSSAACDGSGFGEGATFLGSSDETTDGGGDVSFDVTLAAATSAGEVVTATATDPAGNTSEFSACETVVTVVDGPSMTVNTVADTDDGACTLLNCTLREAIDDADSTPGLDTISFDIPGPGVHTIAPTSALPAIDQPVVIDATTQPGYSGTPLIELNGTGAGAGVNGLFLLGGGTTVRGLAINRFGGAGLLITTVGGNTIQGNFIGTNPAGTLDLGNGGRGIDIRTPNTLVGGTSPGAGNLVAGNSGEGVTFQAGSGSTVQGNLLGTDVTGSVAIANGTANLTLFSTATGTLVGGTAVGAGNLISGGPFGILLSGSGNSVQGNLIGTNLAGTADLGNTANGISVSGANNLIGGSTANARNVISGNNQSGIILDGATATGNIIQGNYIGTNAAGTAAIGNSLAGITVRASNNTIGGVATGAGNLISGNTLEGIRFLTDAGLPTNNTVQGNLIGTDAGGTSAIPNSVGVRVNGGTDNTLGGSVSGAANVIAFNTGPGITAAAGTGTRVAGNSIHSNGSLGIDLGANGVTVNDSGDADTGANNLQNFPDVDTVVVNQSTTRFEGTLDTADGTYRVELFSSPSCDPSGHGEGGTLLGSTDVTVSGAPAPFSVELGVVATVGAVATATATDASGNSSEFSACRTIEAPAEFALDVTKAGAGSGTVTSDPAGIDCGATCSAEFDEGTAVTLAAVPEPGSTFEGWSGEGCSGTDTCTVTMDAARAVTATFGSLASLVQAWMDDFDGAILDAAMWNTSLATSGVRWCASTQANHLSVAGLWQDVSTQSCHGLLASPPHGSITVGGGEASFGAGIRRTFPYVWWGRPSRSSPFPSTGAFVLEVRMRFDSLAPNGTEFHVREWPNSDPVGDNPPGDTPPGGDVFSIGACGACGLVVNLLGVTAAVPGDATGYHDYRLENVNDAYSVWVDGVRLLGPVASSVRPNAIWIGNPVFTHWTSSDWTDLTMDSVRLLAEQMSLSVTKDGSGGGTVTSSPAGIDCGATCSAEFDANQVVTLTATPDGSSTFTGWSGAGCSGTGDCVVTMDQMRIVTATFTASGGGTTLFPSSFTIESGSLNGGTVASLNADDDNYLVVRSTKTARTATWYGTFSGVDNAASSLAVTYKGKSSATCTQVISIFNWTNSTWTQLDSRSIGTTEVLISNLGPSGSPADFVSGISGIGDVRVRVSCSAATAFNLSGDLLELSV